MSIKIYNGYTFRSVKKINSFKFLNNLNKINERTIRYHKNELIKEFYIDHFEKIKKQINFNDIEIDSYNLDNFYTKNSCLVIFPQIDKKTYCMIFADFYITQLIQSTFNLKYFPYYDNIDRHSSFNKREWKRNYFKWNNILDNYTLTPNQAGLSFQVNTTIYDITKSDFDIFFGNKENIEKLKLKIHKNNFIKNEYKKEKKISKILKEYSLIDKKIINSELNDLEIPYFNFPIKNINNDNFSFNYTKNIPFYLNDLVLKFNTSYNIELLKRKKIILNDFKNIYDYKKTTNIEKTFLYLNKNNNDFKYFDLKNNKNNPFTLSFSPTKEISVFDFYLNDNELKFLLP